MTRPPPSRGRTSSVILGAAACFAMAQKAGRAADGGSECRDAGTLRERAGATFVMNSQPKHRGTHSGCLIQPDCPAWRSRVGSDLACPRFETFEADSSR